MQDAPQIVKIASRTALRGEAQALRRTIVMGIREQAPGGGKKFEPLSPLTLATRQLKRDKSGKVRSKILQVTGELANGIAVIPQVPTTEAFIGVPRKTRKADGGRLVDIAQIHEFGSQPIVIPITPKMRGFLAKLFELAGKGSGVKRGGGRGVIVLMIPERPFLRPAFESWKRGNKHAGALPVSERFKIRTLKACRLLAAKKGIESQYFNTGGVPAGGEG